MTNCRPSRGRRQLGLNWPQLVRQRAHRDPSTQDKLTPQELQIALVLAGGKTTREAAGALFLSPKTVEYHLRSVYRKFGINSRDELAVIIGSAAAD